MPARLRHFVDFLAGAVGGLQAVKLALPRPNAQALRRRKLGPHVLVAAVEAGQHRGGGLPVGSGPLPALGAGAQSCYVLSFGQRNPTP